MATRGWEKATPNDVRHRRPLTTMTQKPRSKYGAIRTTVDGVSFASKREAARYGELKLLEKAGKVRALRLQPRYALCPLIIDKADCRDLNAGQPSPRRLPAAYYVADFEYEESHLGEVWSLIVEDVKGRKTEAYGVKKRWFQSQYGIQIRET